MELEKLEPIRIFKQNMKLNLNNRMKVEMILIKNMILIVKSYLLNRFQEILTWHSNASVECWLREKMLPFESDEKDGPRDCTGSNYKN